VIQYFDDRGTIGVPRWSDDDVFVGWEEANEWFWWAGACEFHIEKEFWISSMIIEKDEEIRLEIGGI